MIKEIIEKAQLKDWKIRYDENGLHFVCSKFSITCCNYERRKTNQFFEWLDSEISLCDKLPKIWSKSPTEKEYKEAKDIKAIISDLKVRLEIAYNEVKQDIYREAYELFYKDYIQRRTQNETQLRKHLR